MANWNPWHGCRPISPGCANCYVYRIDRAHGRDPSQVFCTREFDLPVQKRRDGSWRIPAGEMVWTCFSSDFLLDTADEWRPLAWSMMGQRPDLDFLFITKRIHRFEACTPPGWGEGWDNVYVCSTVENQDRADFRLPLLQQASIRHKAIVCEPLLGPIDLSPWLNGDIFQVVAGGESGQQARPCRYEWILDIRRQCMEAGVPFFFKQTGARLIRDGRLYQIPRRLQHIQARRADINYRCRSILPRPIHPRGGETDETTR